MLIPARVQLRYWFYPIGNTPAVNLLRDRAPREGSRATTILCLACGGIRSVLFTLSTEAPSAGRSYEVTLCDFEPAVLARAAFLFTFLAAWPCAEDGEPDGEPDGEAAAGVLWEVYYHIFIRSRAKRALARHVARLLAASTSSDEWHRSSYGAALKFYSENTFHEVRQCWQRYLDACGDGREGEIREAVQETVRQNGLDDGRVLRSGTRATGVHASSSGAVMSQASRAYWRTGVVAGNGSDCAALEQEGGGHANPLLCVSSAPLGRFAMHYATDPLHGFHLAEAFDAPPADESEMLNRLSSTAKSQFRGWCEHFTEHMRTGGGLRIFLHCGEALSLCYELQRHAHLDEAVPAHLHTYARPWSSVGLDLGLGQSSHASCSFDVIDTSNIIDHVGILNLLPAVRPLLNDSVLSVLYTETLLSAAREMTAYLDELLRVDVASFGVIAGLAPTASLLGTASEQYGREAFLGLYGRATGQAHVRICWKTPSGGDHGPAGGAGSVIAASADELASLLFEWYHKIFAPFEDLSIQLSENLRRATDPISHDLGYYTRTTLVALVSLARRHVQADWPKCIELLMAKIHGDKRLIVGSNSWQELNLLWHVGGIMYRVATLEKSPKAGALDFAAMMGCHVADRFPGWADMPGVVAIALVVPRERLHVFTSTELGRLGTPGLHLAVYHEALFENSFHAIHACFGRLTTAGPGGRGTIDEDALGWRGQSGLIVTCLVPAFQLLVGRPGETRAALVVNTSVSVSYLIPVLGPHLRVFTTPVDDPHHFHVLPALPGVMRRSPHGPSLPTQPGPGRRAEPAVSVALSRGRLELLTRREQLCSDDAEREHLQSGAPVHVAQESPCSMTLRVGPQSRRLTFPLPIDGSASRTRVARRQLWVEVAAPISLAARANGYELSPFPVVGSETGQSVAWGMGRINLAQSPVMAGMSTDALSVLFSTTISTRERDAHASPDRRMEFPGALLGWKQSVAAILANFACDDNDTGRRWQGFRLDARGDSDTLIFANALRHDKDSGFICLDAHVVPLTSQRIQNFSRAHAQAMGGYQVVGIEMAEREEVLWKHVMPALVERCRYGWQHRPTCEYLTPTPGPPRCPRSLEHGLMAICSCGEGQDVASLPPAFRAFAPFATRIALTPLSAVPFAEPMALDAHLSSRERSPETPQDACGQCGAADGHLKVCARCHSVKYCNRACQSAAWSSHKRQCRTG